MLPRASLIFSNIFSSIQPILGLCEIIRPKVNKEDSEYVDVIVRNTKRLQRLTEEILDVTRIESQYGELFLVVRVFL